MNWPGIPSVMKKGGCYLAACGLDLACQHALFGPHDFGPHSVFKTVDLYAKCLHKNFYFYPFFKKDLATLSSYSYVATICYSLLKMGQVCLSLL